MSAILQSRDGQPIPGQSIAGQSSAGHTTPGHTTPGQKSAGQTMTLGVANAATFAELRSVRADAVVTITFDGSKASGSVDRDRRAAVDALVARAIDRLEREPVGVEPGLADALKSLVDWVFRAPGSAGWCLFVGAGIRHAVALPFAPGDRVVVDPTFLTREVARAVWSSPELCLLVLSAADARLFLTGTDGALEVHADGFPMHADRARPRGDGRPSAGDPMRFYRDVDVAAGAFAAGRPVVLFAAEPAAGRFRSIASSPPIGVIHGNRMGASADDLMALTVPVREAHLHELGVTERERLARAATSRRAATGLIDVWRHAIAGQVDTLIVDRGFRPAGRIDGDTVVLTDDPEEPGVTDDLVDDLIEQVSVFGGEVCFVNPGDLGPDAVAAVLRWAAHAE